MHRHHTPRHTHPDRGEGRQVQINVLGDFRVTVDGVPSPARSWARNTASALVKILALAPGHRLHREKVMDLLWPDEAPEISAPRLHKAAHFARRAAGHHDAVMLREDIVWLFPGAEIVVDAIRFEELARAAVRQNDPLVAREALRWYGGELLPGDPYAEWAADRRELLHLRQLDVLRVAGEWRELAELAPADEEAHVQLMRRHIEAGDGAAAVRQYHHLERMLERDLGVTPGSEVRQVCIEACHMDDHQGMTDASTATSARVVDLLAEMAELVNRQRVVLAELSAVGAASPALVA